MVVLALSLVMPVGFGIDEAIQLMRKTKAYRVCERQNRALNSRLASSRRATVKDGHVVRSSPPDLLSDFKFPAVGCAALQPPARGKRAKCGSTNRQALSMGERQQLPVHQRLGSEDSCV